MKELLKFKTPEITVAYFANQDVITSSQPVTVDRVDQEGEIIPAAKIK